MLMLFIIYRLGISVFNPSLSRQYIKHTYIAIIWKNIIDYEEREIDKTKLKIEAQKRKGMSITYV